MHRCTHREGLRRPAACRAHDSCSVACLAMPGWWCLCCSLLAVYSSVYTSCEHITYCLLCCLCVVQPVWQQLLERLEEAQAAAQQRREQRRAAGRCALLVAFAATSGNSAAKLSSSEGFNYWPWQIRNGVRAVGACYLLICWLAPIDRIASAT